MAKPCAATSAAARLAGGGEGLAKAASPGTEHGMGKLMKEQLGQGHGVIPGEGR